MTPRGIIYIWTVIVLSFLSQSCNYHYYKGVKLEDEQRYEEANIEYRQAYIESPNNSKFAEAFRRTSFKTAENFIERYYRYLKEKKYFRAFKVLEQAGTLSPNDSRIKRETTKWFKVLLAGKVELTNIGSFLRNQIPLTEEISLEVHLNTSDISRKLEAPINYQTKIFKTEDVLYDPSPEELMSYSINCVGIKMFNPSTGQKRLKKFIDFKTSVLIGVQGRLEEKRGPPTPINEFSSSVVRKGPDDGNAVRSSSGDRIIYSLTLDGNAVKADSSVKYIDFLPQTLYVNKKDRRYFMDFGYFEVSRKKRGGFWTLRRANSSDKRYLADLQKNIILSPYFYFREGGYPFVVAEDSWE